MQAGRLNEIIYFYRLVKYKTETGSEDNYYQEDHKCRARVTYSGGDRENENGDIFYSHHIIFEIRQGLDFNELYRIVWNGRPYRILCIEQDRHNQSTRIVTDLINE